MSFAVAPVERLQRIASIDILRGVALLGILLMNVQDFGIPHPAYWNPTLWGGSTGADLAYWFINQTLFEGKMRAVFSMLFGASFLVLTSRAEARGPEARAELADIYYRRTLWLMAIGLFHAIFIWFGDILAPYALCGLFLYPLRKLSARALIIAGLVIWAAPMPFQFYDAWERNQARHAGESALAREAAGRNLNKDEADAKKKWQKTLERRKPDRKKVEKEVNGYRLGYWANTKIRHEKLTENLQFLYTWIANDTGSMMLIGMGLMKLGVFTAEQPARVYFWMMALGYGLGVSVTGWAAAERIRQHWDPASIAWNALFYHYGRLVVGLGHVGLVMLLCRRGWLGPLARPLAAVGQTALSNYLLTSVVCSFVFYGYGLSLHGKLARHQLLYVVAAVWVFNLVASPLWLRRYRFGPVEWLWRSLTYWKRQPMRLEPAAS